MGCFNGTCGISNLPIFAGDKIALIPLIKTTIQPTYNACYPCDNFAPFGFVVFGEYDDYGGIEKAETSDINRDFFNSLEFAIYSEDKYTPLKKCNEYDSFDDFLSDVICGGENIFVKTKMGNGNPYYEISFMMIHRELYDLMITNLGNRKPYGKTNSCKTVIIENFHSIVQKEIDTLKQYQEIGEQCIDSEKQKDLIDTSQYFSIRKISSDVFQLGNLVTNNIWDFFAEAILTTNSMELITEATNKLLFQMALSAARKGFLCTSGWGSQSEETRIHYLIAEFTINQIKRTSKKRCEQNRQSKSAYGHEEPFFL